MNARRLLLALALLLTTTLTAQVDPARFAGMRWRMIGPFRGGRTVGATGIASQPNVFYIGVNNGGVWKSTDYGRVWVPIFDQQPTGSVGSVAVAPSDPNIVYVGSGEGLQRPDLSTGDGVYKSTDAGKTWTHLGLRDGQQLPMIAVDPRDANRLFVAVLGHPYGPNAERGIFRSTDGGNTFEKVLYKDENTGGIDVILDPSNPQVVYAALWEHRHGPWENAEFEGPNSGVYKSSDGGTTWTQLTNGLPSGTALGRAGLEVSRSNPNRLYTICGTDAKSGGLYRSDDAGASWTRVNTDERIWGRPGDFNEVRADPRNPDVVYVANVVTWKSADGGKTFHSFRGAPGGDDYHRVWINPNDSNTILIASDQGAIVTVNGGTSWSSWYNQPTAQMFHVSADNAFPYRLCGGQQESGSACVNSRSDAGEIVSFADWYPASAEEYGYAVPDPLNPDLVYGGRITRWDRRTKQVEDITPKPLRGPGFRVVRTAPIAFSPADPHVLFFASNTVWKTTTGGRTWTEISPDLTRKTWAVPASAGKYAPDVNVTQRGVVYALAPSPLDVGTLWAGTDDGLIHLTTDGGKTWKDVTPPQLVPWAKVSILEASHFDKRTAYAAINTFRLDDLRPHILRTRDGGKTWTEIVRGIPDAGIINVVREDPKTRGLLFAGSEREVFVSFDDGEQWQSLRLNMPASSIRDLVVHDDDLAVATHGRGFWILDDIEPLRQARATTTLLKPQRATRVRWSQWPDTPLPPDEPTGQNPPDGAILDYVLGAPASNVTLEITDADGKLVRRFSSSDNAEPPKDTGNVPWYWIRPPQRLGTSAGMHRFVWDLHYPPVPQKATSFPISAVPYDTAPNDTSPWVMPGTYTVTLTVDGKTSTQPLVVRMDPRVKTSREDLAKQFAESMKVYGWIRHVAGAAGPEDEEDETPKGSEPSAASVERSARRLLDLLQSADVAPNAALVAAVNALETSGAKYLK
jgi:photosystem II stability/assembly factor-like uncharacterized protein